MINKLGGDSRIAWLKVEKASLIETEAEFISYYQPSLNIARYIPWKSGKTVTVRVPIALEDVTLKVARAVDSGKITFEQIFQKLYEKYPHLRDL